MANERNAALALAQDARLDVLEGQRSGGDDSRLREAPQHHADVRRPHAEANVDRSTLGHPARTARSRGRRHGCARLSPMTSMADSTGVRGRLKVFLGYAAGVGKTYQMLTEARGDGPRRRRRRHRVLRAARPPGHDRPHRGPRDHPAAGDRVPRCATRGDGHAGRARAGRPRVAVVDELPHTNVPGSPREKRWEDVHELLDAGIDVLTTMNVQHLESLNDQIWQITGDPGPRDDARLGRAAGRRSGDGGPDAAGAAQPAGARRGLLRPNAPALPWRTSSRNRPWSPCANSPCGRPRPSWRADCRPTTHRCPTRPRCRTARSACCSSSARSRRVRRSSAGAAASPTASARSAWPSTCRGPRISASWRKTSGERLERHLNFARALQIETRVLEGRDVARTLLAFAGANGVTQIFVDRNAGSRERSWFGPSLIERIVNGARGLQVTVVADRTLRSGP